MRTLILSTIAAALFVSGRPTAQAPAPTATTPAPRPWTLMVYGAADNNADGPILEFLHRLRVALDDDPGLELVVFIDRSTDFSTDASLFGEDFADGRIYRLRRDTAERLDASAFFPDMRPGEENEVDSADPVNVGRFVAFCKQRFPAERYGLMIYSHADGIAMCPDDESGREMGIAALSERVGPEASVDLLALELCNMAGIEVAYQWRPGNGGFSADVLVAIPNAGIPLDWDRAFGRLRSKGREASARGVPVDPATLSATDLGRLVIEEGHAGRRTWVEAAMSSGRYDLEDPEVLAFLREKAREAAGCYDLTCAAGVKAAVDALARGLAAADCEGVVGELRGFGDDRMLNYAARGKFDRRPYVDLYELLDLIARCDELGEDVRGKARAARRAVDDMVVASFGVEQGFPAFRPGRHGLFIVFPCEELGSSRPWPGFSWYTPLADTHPASGSWAFLADGSTPGNGKVETWFELLAAWSAERGAPLPYAW